MHEALFSILSFSPGPFWFLIIFFPTSKKAMLAVDIYLFALAIGFSILTIPVIPEIFPLLIKPEFSSMYKFLSSPLGVLGSWNHMILADLWLGRWVSRDCLKSSSAILPRVLFVVPILFFGPLGLCIYLIYRTVRFRKFSLLD